MRRAIAGFRQDDQGDWVAELSCFHRQHMRHRPPFSERPWVLTEAGRTEHIGTELDCPQCDRAELPDGLTLVRTAGPFNHETLPFGLRRDHLVSDGRWGLLRVMEGTARFVLATDPPVDRDISAGESQPIPPGTRHHVVVDAPVVLAVDFLERRAS